MALQQNGKRARLQPARLHDAVRRYDVLSVKALIAGGAELEVDSFGRTALHLAVAAASQGRSATVYRMQPFWRWSQLCSRPTPLHLSASAAMVLLRSTFYCILKRGEPRERWPRARAATLA